MVSDKVNYPGTQS